MIINIAHCPQSANLVYNIRFGFQEYLTQGFKLFFVWCSFNYRQCYSPAFLFALKKRPFKAFKSIF
nr:MAG TPA: hypothetical protein [Caudoviricetes sp.]